LHNLNFLRNFFNLRVQIYHFTRYFPILGEKNTDINTLILKQLVNKNGLFLNTYLRTFKCLPKFREVVFNLAKGVLTIQN